MKVSRIKRLTTVNKMYQSGHYVQAKHGNFSHAIALISDLKLNFSPSVNVQYVCPVNKQPGNQIPLALAHFLAAKGNSVVYDSILLQNSKRGSSFSERLFYEPQFSGPVLPGNYLICDDVHTTGVTLKALKMYIENYGGNVISAVVLGSSFGSLKLDPSNIKLKMLLSKFPGIENYFDVCSFSDNQISFLLQFSSMYKFYHFYASQMKKSFLNETF